MSRTSNETSVCVCCGGKDFEWGKAQGQSDIKFKSDDANVFVRHTVFGGEDLHARLCNDCGNVQLFLSKH